MNADTTRRLRAEELQRTTMKTRVAQWRRRTLPCTCHNCRLLAAIQAMVAAGQVVQVRDVSPELGHGGPEADGTRH